MRGLGQAIGKDPPTTSVSVAKEAPYLQLNPDRNAFPRKVAQRAPIVAMNPRRCTMALRTSILLNASPQHHQKQAASFDLHFFQYDLSSVWNQRFLFHRAQPEVARAALLLPPFAPLEKCLPWFTECADEPSSEWRNQPHHGPLMGG
jgi:hypothetical protein